MNGRRWVAIVRLVGIGWYIGLSLALPLMGGRWLDRKLNTHVFFTFVGLGLGVIVAAIGLYYLLRPAMRD